MQKNKRLPRTPAGTGGAAYGKKKNTETSWKKEGQGKEKSSQAECFWRKTDPGSEPNIQRYRIPEAIFEPAESVVPI